MSKPCGAFWPSIENPLVLIERKKGRVRPWVGTGCTRGAKGRGTEQRQKRGDMMETETDNLSVDEAKETVRVGVGGAVDKTTREQGKGEMEQEDKRNKKERAKQREGTRGGEKQQENKRGEKRTWVDLSRKPCAKGGSEDMTPVRLSAAFNDHLRRYVGTSGRKNRETRERERRYDGSPAWTSTLSFISLSFLSLSPLFAPILFSLSLFHCHL